MQSRSDATSRLRTLFTAVLIALWCGAGSAWAQLPLCGPNHMAETCGSPDVPQDSWDICFNNTTSQAITISNVAPYIQNGVTMGNWPVSGYPWWSDFAPANFVQLAIPANGTVCQKLVRAMVGQCAATPAKQLIFVYYFCDTGAESGSLPNRYEAYFQLVLLAPQSQAQLMVCNTYSSMITDDRYLNCWPVNGSQATFQVCPTADDVESDTSNPPNPTTPFEVIIKSTSC